MCLRCGIGAVMGVVLKLLSFENFGNALEVDGVRWAGLEGVRGCLRLRSSYGEHWHCLLAHLT